MTNRKLILIFACIFLLFAAGALLMGSIQPEDNVAVIKVNGKIFRQLDLNKNETFTIETSKGYNNVIVKDGTIRIDEATCPDQLCVRHGRLRSKYDSIVCLPNKIVIEYKTKKDVDAVAGR